MRFENVHSISQKIDAISAGERGGVRNRSRSIVCKFSFFGDREKVRGNSKNFKDTQFYISEQFPPEVAAKRRRIFKKVKEDRLAGRKAWVLYDTLFVDGKPGRDAYDGPDGLRYLVWNCNGLSASKREDQNFISLFLQHDIIILTESWTCKSSKIDFSGYRCYNFLRKYRQNIIAVE